MKLGKYRAALVLSGIVISCGKSASDVDRASGTAGFSAIASYMAAPLGARAFTMAANICDGSLLGSVAKENFTTEVTCPTAASYRAAFTRTQAYTATCADGSTHALSGTTGTLVQDMSTFMVSPTDMGTIGMIVNISGTVDGKPIACNAKLSLGFSAGSSMPTPIVDCDQSTCSVNGVAMAARRSRRWPSSTRKFAATNLTGS